MWNVLFGATPRAQVAAFCPVEANACFFVVFEREEEQRGKAGAQMGMSRRAGVAGFWKAPRLLDWPFPPLWKKKDDFATKVYPSRFLNEMYIRIFFQVLQPTVTRIYFHPSFTIFKVF